VENLHRSAHHELDRTTLADMVARRPAPDHRAVIDWHQADEALAALRSNQIAGKAVLSIDGSDMQWKGVAPDEHVRDRGKRRSRTSSW
jgi:hypothetical protein